MQVSWQAQQFRSFFARSGTGSLAGPEVRYGFRGNLASDTEFVASALAGSGTDFAQAKRC